MKYIVSALFCFSFLLGLGQEKYDLLQTSSKKAKKLYIKADQAFEKKEDAAVVEYLSKALEEDPDFLDAYMLLSDVYLAQANYKEAIVQLERATALAPNSFVENYFYLGMAHFQLEEYVRSGEVLRKFMGFKRGKNFFMEKAQQYAVLSDFRLYQIQHPVPFEPHNMGPEVNSIYDEYLPSFTIDEKVLLITRRMIRNPNAEYTYPNSQEDFYETRKMNGKWVPAYNLGAPVNTPYNEGAQCISYDGQYLFYTACERPDGMGSCDLYVSVRKGNYWSKAYNLGPVVNSTKWDSQPNFASDGKTLYFISKRNGGLGASDIWQTVLQNDGTWSKPVNLGDKINTPGDEYSPFMHPDGKTLYFSSTGHLGMGDFDLFYSRKNSDGSWSDPVNLGYPINTSGDENSLIVSPNGKTAYFASNRLKGVGNMDLYSFELYPEARPDRVTYFKGKVFDAANRQPLVARFELIDLKTREVVQQSFSEATKGEFMVPLPLHRNYALNVSREGYMFFTKNFSLDQGAADDKIFLMDVPMKPIAEDQVVVLDNIFFDTDKYMLRPESVVELEKLAGFMVANPSVNIEVRGHTDNVGDAASNMVLSENRAKAVYRYLVDKGIAANRLQYKGYGETQPIASNDTAEGRQQNRRTEYKIIKK